MKVAQNLTVGVCASRREHFERILEMVGSQSVYPKKIIIVTTYDSVGLFKLVLMYSEIVRKLSKLTKVTIIQTNFGNISHSRNMVLEHTKTKYLLFFDDDIYFKSNFVLNIFYIISKISSSSNSIVALVPLVLPIIFGKEKISQFTVFMFYLYHLGVTSLRIGVVKDHAMAVIFLDADYVKNKKIVFDESVSSGEDILFTRAIANSGGGIVFLPGLFVHHKYVENFFSFVKKIHWYTKESVKHSYNFFDFLKPRRALHFIFFPLFIASQVVQRSISFLSDFSAFKKNLLLSGWDQANNLKTPYFPSLLFFMIAFWYIFPSKKYRDEFLISLLSNKRIGGGA